VNNDRVMRYTHSALGRAIWYAGVKGVLALATLLGIVGVQPSVRAVVAAGLPERSSVSFPVGLRNLPTEPVGVGVFGTSLVFPQFTMDGTSSAIELYDTRTKGISRYLVPAAAQGHMVSSVVGDPKAGYCGWDCELISCASTSPHTRWKSFLCLPPS